MVRYREGKRNMCRTRKGLCAKKSINTRTYTHISESYQYTREPYYTRIAYHTCTRIPTHVYLRHVRWPSPPFYTVLSVLLTFVDRATTFSYTRAIRRRRLPLPEIIRYCKGYTGRRRWSSRFQSRLLLISCYYYYYQ